MPRMFFIAEDQLDELERHIDELPGRQTKVAYKLLEGIKDNQVIPSSLMKAIVAHGPDTQAQPPSGPPAPVGKPEVAEPASASAVVKGANAVAITAPPPKD